MKIFVEKHEAVVDCWFEPQVNKTKQGDIIPHIKRVSKVYLYQRFAACRSAGIRRTDFQFNNKSMNEEQNFNKPPKTAFLQGAVMPSLRLKKYNANFERDFKWYMTMRHKFNFDGAAGYWNKKGENIIQYDKNGVDGKEAFFQWDSNGKIKPTKHPNILHTLLKVKGSCNLHIKMYAEDRAACNMGFIEFRALCIHFKAPQWFREAVEKQKVKYWNFGSNGA